MVPVSDKRRPAWIHQTGDEAGPRFSMANERTLLAWVRTSLGVLAGSVALLSVALAHELAVSGR